MIIELWFSFWPIARTRTPPVHSVTRSVEMPASWIPARTTQATPNASSAPRVTSS